LDDLCLVDLSKLIELVKSENTRQLEKWGIQDHDLPTWMLTLNEEVGKLNKAVLDQCTGDRLIEEAIKVATLALKIAEMNLEGDWN
jgi:hypothetical protein